MALRWVSVDARTGLIGDPLDDLDLGSGGALKATLGQYETMTATVPLPATLIDYAEQVNAGLAPVPATQETLAQLADWRLATRPGGACAIALDEQDQPIGGGLIVQRTTDHTAAAQLSIVTMEAYLDRRYSGDRAYIQDGQNDIVENLIVSFIADGTLPGIPIRVQKQGVNTLRDLTYADSDDKTIYSVMAEITGLDGGPEWTVSWERQHAPERITPVLTVADRIGVGVQPGLIRPQALFALPGCVVAPQLLEDYSSGAGATLVTATSGSGPGRFVATQQAADDGRPTFEYRWAPSDKISDPVTLAAHAQRAISVLAPGKQALTLTALLDDAPVLGVDWDLGWDIAYNLFAPAWADGLEGVARCIGWERTDTTVTPILAVPTFT